jgi:hypothetical protein
MIEEFIPILEKRNVFLNPKTLIRRKKNVLDFNPTMK